MYKWCYFYVPNTSTVSMCLGVELKTHYQFLRSVTQIRRVCLLAYALFKIPKFEKKNSCMKLRGPSVCAVQLM